MKTELPVVPLRPEYVHPKSEVNVWFGAATTGTVPPRNTEGEKGTEIKRSMHVYCKYENIE